MIVADGLLQNRQQPMHSPTRQCTHLKHRRIAHEVQLAFYSRVHGFAAVGVEHLPLVQNHHDRAASAVDTFSEPLILVGNTHSGVDHEQRNVGFVD